MSTSDSTSAGSERATSARDEQGNGAGRPASNLKVDCLAKLEELKALRPGWDGYGAPQLKPTVIDAVRDFIVSLPDSLRAKSMVVPLSSGNVQLEWHRDSKVLELEFETPETVHYLKWHPESQVEEENIVPASERAFLFDLIGWFVEDGEDG